MTRTKRLLRENNAFEKQLNPEFNAVLTDMVVYLRSAPVSEYNQELVRRDLGQMFLDAQRRGDSPADVIGEDYRQFCDQVLGVQEHPADVPALLLFGGHQQNNADQCQQGGEIFRLKHV